MRETHGFAKRFCVNIFLGDTGTEQVLIDIGVCVCVWTKVNFYFFVINEVYQFYH